MKTSRIVVVTLSLLSALAGLAFAQPKPKKLPQAVDTIYLPTAPDMLRYQPGVYEERYLRVIDLFGAATDTTILSKTAIRAGFDPGRYFIFDTSHTTSEMRCYVDLKDKRNLDVVHGLAKDAEIILYGELKWVQLTRVGRTLHFRVDHIELGKTPPPVMTIELRAGKNERKLYRIWEPREYEFVYPPAKTKQEEEQNAFLVDISYKMPEEPPPKVASSGGKTYIPVDSGRIPYDPRSYVGRNLLVKDDFYSVVDPKDFSSEAEKLGFRPSSHILFKTPPTGNGSDLSCYVSKDKTFYVDLVEALVQNVHITLYGAFVAYDDRSVLRLKHFDVDRLDVGWEGKPVIEMRFGPLKSKPEKGFRMYRPDLYEIDFPPWAQTKAYTLLLKCIY